MVGDDVASTGADVAARGDAMGDCVETGTGTGFKTGRAVGVVGPPGRPIDIGIRGAVGARVVVGFMVGDFVSSGRFLVVGDNVERMGDVVGEIVGTDSILVGGLVVTSGDETGEGVVGEGILLGPIVALEGANETSISGGGPLLLPRGGSLLSSIVK
jgi:hypothetical protein